MSAPTMRSASPSLINAEGGHAVANVADVARIDEVQAAVACARSMRLATFICRHITSVSVATRVLWGNWTLPPGAG